MMKRHSVWPHVVYIQNMKRFALITALLLVAETANEQAVASLPVLVNEQTLLSNSTKLTVTGEIVGYGYKPTENFKDKSQLILYAKVRVRNRTNFPREIIMMTCSWDSSWMNEGPNGFCPWICAANFPVSRIIPASQSLVFYGPLYHRRETIVDSRADFALGFLDSSEDYFFYSPEKFDEYLKNNVVYWSNRLSGNIDLTTIPLVSGSWYQNQRYYLSVAGK